MGTAVVVVILAAENQLLAAAKIDFVVLLELASII